MRTVQERLTLLRVCHGQKVTLPMELSSVSVALLAGGLGTRLRSVVADRPESTRGDSVAAVSYLFVGSGRCSGLSICGIVHRILRGADRNHFRKKPRTAPAYLFTRARTAWHGGRFEVGKHPV